MKQDNNAMAANWCLLRAKVWMGTLAVLSTMQVQANAPVSLDKFKRTFTQPFQASSTQQADNYAVNVTRLSTPTNSPALGSVMPTIAVIAQPKNVAGELDLIQAVQLAVNRHPAIAKTIAALSQQYANVDVAKADYWPQIQAGFNTGALGTSEVGQQLLTVSATQTLYDFGKVKNNVDAAQANVDYQKAEVLKQIDSVALQAAQAIVNINRYTQLQEIAQAQLAGISHILDIARLRANAGISSQADPIQAQTRYESAQSNLLAVNTLLNEWREKLRTLIGSPLPEHVGALPAGLLNQAALYQEPELDELPEVLMAQASRRVALAQKENARANRLPTIALEGSVSQAISGVNPNNNKDDGHYSAIRLAVNSNVWRGGALAASQTAANYAEIAARAEIENAYLAATDQARSYREQILGAQQRMQVLDQREKTSVKTRELYQEQYKLGTRTVLDLLNAEQEIHQVAAEREGLRYDIWQNIANYIAVTGKSRSAYALNNTIVQGLDIQP